MICEQNRHNSRSEKYICVFILVCEVSNFRMKNCSTVVVVFPGFILQGGITKELWSLPPPFFLYSPVFHHSNNSTAPTDKLLRRRESITLISFHLAAVQQAGLINVCNEGYKRAQIFGSKGNLSLLCNSRASHITRLFSALAVNNSPHQSWALCNHCL